MMKERMKTLKVCPVDLKNRITIGALASLAFISFYSLYKHDIIYPTLGMKIGALCLGLSCLVLIIRYFVISHMYDKLYIKRTRLASYISLHSFCNEEGIFTLKEKHTERVIRKRNEIYRLKWLIDRGGHVGYVIAIMLGLMDAILTFIDLFSLDGYFR